MQRLSLVVAFFAIGCGGSTPLTPTPPAPPTPPIPTTYTITGTVTATNGGQPLAGATVALAGNATTTDAGGRYSVNIPTSLSAMLSLSISSAEIVTRTGLVRGGSSRIADLDAIRLDGTFDPSFYRQFAHDALEGQMYATARWTQAPKIYMRTIDDKGDAVESRTLSVAVAALSSTAAMFTGGRFGLDTIEQGTGTKIGEAGWTTVTWLTDTSVSYCGRANVGVDRNAIELYYKKPSCSCPGTQIRALTIKHELGHMFGYWHTDNVNDLMYGGAKTGCDLDPVARERYHAAIMYSRPVGSTDPDNDPTDATYSRPLSAARWIP